MDVGLTIPTRGPLATPDAITTIVRRAEELGFAHLSVSDHVVVPRGISSRYPYSASGAWPGAASGECLEQFTLLAYLAAISRKPRLITAVAVIPYRGAMHTAKIAATIDNAASNTTTDSENLNALRMRRLIESTRPSVPCENTTPSSIDRASLER